MYLWGFHKYIKEDKLTKHMAIPTFNEFLMEGVLTNYRSEKEGMRLTNTQLSETFTELLHKLIEERIPFYFECQYKEFNKIGYLMHETINNIKFDGYILDDTKTPESLCKELSDKIIPEVVVEKPGKLHVGRSTFSDLTRANDLDTITVVVKAFKTYSKDKGLNSREVTGNKYEVNVNIDFLCDKTRINDLISYIF